MASLGALAAVVAHEINNPLSGVLTYARLVRKMVDASAPGPERLAAVHKYLRTIEVETARCGSIVRNLLEFSRQSGVVHGEASLNEIIERTLFLVGHKLKLQGIRLSRDLAGDLPLISCDADQLQQAMLALLINAVEAMPEGGELRVATRLGPVAGDRRRWLEAEVTDTGPGIPEDLLPRLFEPFFTTKQDKKGVGLGLSVVFGIVKRHDGRIDVRSQVGRGTTFVVALPERGPVAEELFSAGLPARQVEGS